jgi:hypothetical protein
MAAGGIFTMLCFGLWLHWITFPGVSFWILLLYVFTSLQLTKATAGAVTKHLEGELSFQASRLPSPAMALSFCPSPCSFP